MARNQQYEEDLVAQIAAFRHDPEGFVDFAFPWREPGALERFDGPQDWQRKKLRKFGDLVRGYTLDEYAFKQALDETLPDAGFGKGRDATASGKGIGKSALVSWVVWWAVCTMPDTRGVLTAGTEPQLRTKTWPEVTKWYQLLICKHWFHATATCAYSTDMEHEKQWRFDAIAWNENRPEAFAGLHNIGRRIVVIFDEASQIADNIWDTSDGIFTDADTEVLFLAFGNPTRGQGRFFDCFNALRHRWTHDQIDSRTVAISDKKQIAEWVDDYGEDSDYVRMNVKGMFPRVSSMQFIAFDVVAAARKREVSPSLSDALIIGVDVARFGDDQTVIYFRKGRDARTIPPIKLRGLDTMAVAAKVADVYDKYKADALFVDGTGVGGGVCDRLVMLGYPVREINFGGSSDRVSIDVDATRYANKRSEMWGYMREWLKAGAIPDSSDLEADLTGIYYGFKDGRQGSEIILEKKDHMKARGLASPDEGDALALTFAYPVAPRFGAGGIHQENNNQRGKALTEYDPTA